MEGKGRGDDRIFPSENYQLKNLGIVIRLFGISLGFGKFYNWDVG